MTATLPSNERGRWNAVLLFLVLAIAFAVAVGTLSTLPMTRHAAQGRTGTALDAETIRQMIDQRACKPIEVYVCPPVSQSKLICYLRSSSEGGQLWAGVIVGMDMPHPIITGYVAPYSYWEGANLRDGCYRVSRID